MFSSSYPIPTFHFALFLHSKSHWIKLYSIKMSNYWNKYVEIIERKKTTPHLLLSNSCCSYPTVTLFILVHKPIINWSSIYFSTYIWLIFNMDVATHTKKGLTQKNCDIHRIICWMTNQILTQFRMPHISMKKSVIKWIVVN